MTDTVKIAKHPQNNCYLGIESFGTGGFDKSSVNVEIWPGEFEEKKTENLGIESWLG